jgi:hypothetical protein
MAKAVSKLAILISANTTRVMDGFSKVGKRAKQLKKSLSGGGGGARGGGGAGGGGMLGGMLGGGMGKMLGPIAGIMSAGLAVRKVSSEFKAAAARMDDLAKTAARLDMTTDALNGLRNAGEKTGVPVKTLDKSLEKMSKGISETGAGMGEAKRSFDELGIEWKKIAGLAPEDQFKLIAQRLNTVGLQSEKTRHALAIFGRGGGALINTMALGADGIDKLSNEVKDLNGMMEGDAKTFEDFNDAVDDMSKALEGVWNEISIAMIPVLTDLVLIIKDLGKAGGGWLKWLSGREKAEKHTANLMAALGHRNLQRAAQAARLNKAEMVSDKKKNDARREAEDKTASEIARRAQQIRESMQSPLERAAKQIRDIRRLFSMGAIDASTSARAVAKAQQELFSATRPQQREQRERMTVGAVLKGTMQEANAIREQRAAAHAATRQRKEMIQEARRRRDLLDQIAKNTRPENNRPLVAGLGP